MKSFLLVAWTWISATTHAADSTPLACKLASVKSWPGYDIFGPLASQKKIELWHHGLTLASKGGGCSCCYQITHGQRENLYNIASWFKFPMGGFLALAHCHFSDRNPTLLSRVTDGAMADWRSWNMFQHAFSIHSRAKASHSCNLQDILLWNIALAKTHATGPRLYHSQWAKNRFTLPELTQHRSRSQSQNETI